LYREGFLFSFKVPEDKSVLVRDFIIDKGIEFGETKDKFAE